MPPQTNLWNELTGLGGGFTWVESLPGILSRGVGLVLLVAAMYVFICLLWGGWMWLMSGDDTGAVQKAKDRLTQCLVGFSVLALTYAIALLMQYFLGLNIFQGLPGGTPGGLPPPGVGAPVATPTPLFGNLPNCPADENCGVCATCKTLLVGGTNVKKCDPNVGVSCTVACWSGGGRCSVSGSCDPSAGGSNTCIGGLCPPGGNCGPDAVCDPSTNQCVTDCNTNALVCDEPTLICDTSTGLCVSPPTATPTPTPTIDPNAPTATPTPVIFTCTVGPLPGGCHLAAGEEMDIDCYTVSDPKGISCDGTGAIFLRYFTDGGNSTVLQRIFYGPYNHIFSPTAQSVNQYDIRGDVTAGLFGIVGSFCSQTASGVYKITLKNVGSSGITILDAEIRARSIIWQVIASRTCTP